MRPSPPAALAPLRPRPASALPPSLRVLVRCADGSGGATLTVRRGASLGELGKAIHAELGAPQRWQRLFHRGAALAALGSGTPLAEIGVRDRDTVVLCLRPPAPQQAQPVYTHPAPSQYEVLEHVEAVFGPFRAPPPKPQRKEPAAQAGAARSSLHEAIDQLGEMGFSPDVVREALTRSNLDVTQAAEWLLKQTGGREQAQAQAQAQQGAVASSSAPPAADPPAEELERDKEEDNGEEDEEDADAAAIKLIPEGCDVPAALRIRRLGFALADACEALQKFDNKYEQAVDWLFGGKETLVVNGIAEDAPVIDALLDNESVVEALSSPKLVAAVKEILDEPARLTEYLSDPDLGDVLRQVCEILGFFNPSTGEPLVSGALGAA